MSFLNKLAFWKKDDEFNDADLGLDNGFDPSNDFNQPNDFNNPNSGVSPNDFIERQPMQNQNYAQPNMNPTDNYQVASPVHHEDMSGKMMSKDIELVSYKIDALRASIDSLNQRVINIEHLLREDRENKYKW